MAQNIIINPMTPKDIIDTIRTSKDRKGDLSQTISDFTVTVPALSSVSFTLVAPTDRASIFYTKHSITSDFYDENLFLSRITMDYTQETISFNAIALDSSKELDITYFNSFQIQFSWAFQNNTLQTANVTVFLELINMEISFFENWYRVLIKNSEQQLNEIVVSLGGDSRI